MEMKEYYKEYVQYLIIKCRYCHRILDMPLIDEKAICKGCRIEHVGLSECKDRTQCNEFCSMFNDIQNGR